MAEIAYNDITHKKTSDKVATYKALVCKCKEKIKLLAQCFVNSKGHFIAKEIDNENLQIKLNDIQTQLANVHMQCKDNVATPTAIKIQAASTISRKYAILARQHTCT